MKNFDFVVENVRYNIYDKNKMVFFGWFRDDNPDNIPLLTWRSHANALYTNWLDYYVYQNTPYEW